MNTTVDELFNFSKKEETARRVAFGSQAARKMMPYHGPFSRIGVGAGVSDRSNIGPDTYSNDPINLFLKDMNKKPQNKGGVGFGISKGPRLAVKKKLVTPSPAEYQSVEMQEGKEFFRPFGSSRDRFNEADSVKKPKPGPGQYEHDVQQNRKTKSRDSFGGCRIILPTIATKCHNGEPDKCTLCREVPTGDYFEYRKEVLCRKCYFYQMQSGEKFAPSYLMAFTKVRDCTAFHQHDGTNAKIVTQTEKERKKKKLREAYLSLYYP